MKFSDDFPPHSLTGRISRWRKGFHPLGRRNELHTRLIRILRQFLQFTQDETLHIGIRTIGKDLMTNQLKKKSQSAISWDSDVIDYSQMDEYQDFKKISDSHKAESTIQKCFQFDKFHKFEERSIIKDMKQQRMMVKTPSTLHLD